MGDEEYHKIMNTKKKIVERYKTNIHTEIKHVIIDRLTDNVIAISPTYEDAKVLIKILNRQYKVKNHIITQGGEIE